MKNDADSIRVFLTGGSGFIGGEVVEILRTKGFGIANYDLAPPHLPGQEPYWIKGDVRDSCKLDQEIAAFDPHYILHLASDTDVSVEAVEAFTTTLDGTANVIAALSRAPKLRRFIHVSTQFVVKPGVQPLEERYLEPYTAYGQAKAETERMLWRANPPAPWLILRPTIIWGPHHPSFAEAIFKHIASRNYLHPVAAEPITRAFGFVRNVAQQMVYFLEMPANASNRHVYYLGDATIDYDIWADSFSQALTGKRARRIPKWLLALMGRAGDLAKRLGIPSPIDSGRAFRMSTSSAIDLTPTHALAGLPQVGFDDGVAETVAWLRKYNSSRYRREH